MAIKRLSIRLPYDTWQRARKILFLKEIAFQKFIIGKIEELTHSMNPETVEKELLRNGLE